MQTTRRERLQSLIRQEVATLLEKDVRDPRIPSLTITSVVLTQDAKQATILFTFPGSDKEEEGKNSPIAECISGLQSASGYIRKHLAKALTVRHVPALVFKQDRGLENTVRVHELLKQIAEEKKNE